MKYIIIEDEELARENLQDIIAAIRPDYMLSAILGSVDEAVRFLGKETVNLIFMDVDLGDGTCFDIIEQTQTQIPIIFTTAYNQYALDAFKANSIDYLLKPITETDVERALSKLETIKGIFNTPSNNTYTNNKSKSDRILLSKGKSFSFINIKDIAFFSIEDRCIIAYMYDGSSEITEIANMEEIMDIVADHDFFQLSRSIVASINAIKSIKKMDNQRLHVTVCAGDKEKDVIISSLRRKDFLGWLGR